MAGDNLWSTNQIFPSGSQSNGLEIILIHSGLDVIYDLHTTTYWAPVTLK